MRLPAPLVLPLLLAWLYPVIATAQDVAPALPVPVDTVQVDQDTLVVDEPDLAFDPPPAARPSRPDALQGSVTFSARDSIVIVLGDDEEDLASLYGTASVGYGDARLDAYTIDLFFERDEMRARGLESDSGTVGMPQFQQGSESFSGARLAYNMRTERGRIEEARTAIEEGFVRAQIVTITEDTTLYLRHGVYTTCDCIDDPSYSLRSGKMKIVDQEWIYTGPIQLYLFNIPTPLWLPFGFLPATEGRRSGPLPPRYGEDDRGFYLRDWGWYWAISDYMDLQVQGGLWSRGSWSVRPIYRYSKRGAFSGNLTFDFVRNRSGERRDPDFQVFDTASLRWNHNQTLNPTATLSGDVNLSSTSYMRTISEQYDDRVRQSVSSTIRYSKRWPNAGRSFNMSLTQSQNLATGNANLTLPSVSFSQSSRKPFQRSAVSPGGESWFERITMSYSGRLDNRFDFTPLPDSTRERLGVEDVQWYDALFSPSDYRLATGQETPFRLTATHSIPISSNFSINRIPGIARTFRLNVSQNFNYTENWYTESNRREFDEELGRVISQREAGFVAVRRYNVGASANTTFYGMFPMSVGRFQGLRHTVRPAASFSFSPDFTSDFWGYTRTYIDQEGRQVRYPIVSGVSGKQQTLSLRVDNVFETKVVSVDEDGDDQSRTFKLLDVNLSSAYNFAADSLRMSPININARTRILDQVDVRMDASYSPYWRDPITGREQAQYIFNERPWWPLRMTRVSASLNTSFRSDSRGASRPFESARVQPGDMMGAAAGLDGMAPGGAYRGGDLLSGVRYADFAIPWSLDLDMNFSISRLGTSSTRRAIMNARFDFNLTPNWKVQGRTGYDLIQEEVVLTNLVVMRDFECWQLSLNWTPFGPYQSWGFDLHVKSGHLRDILRLRQPRQDVRGRFGGRLSGAI